MIWTAVLCGTATAVFVVYYGRMNEGEHLDRSADSSVKGIGSMDTRVSKLIQMGVVFPTADDDKGCLFDRRRCNVNEFAHRRFKVTIREKDLEKHFTRSPGPGGQNVNASHTRCQLILDFAKCRSWLSETIVANL
ncbi:hypothetical protein FOZ62_028314, partial [Perkinsus olseni]